MTEKRIIIITNKLKLFDFSFIFVVFDADVNESVFYLEKKKKKLINQR
jgi:hypothetical protein